MRRALGRDWVASADAELVGVMVQLAQEYAGRSMARALVLRGLCGALLGRAARAGARVDPTQPNLAESTLLQRFETLLEGHFREHWRVADYARALAITPTHLSRVVRASTGEPASRAIEARLIREARRHLAFTGLGVATISDTLGFADPAWFSRVFTRVAGFSREWPGAHRVHSGSNWRRGRCEGPDCPGRPKRVRRLPRCGGASYSHGASRCGEDDPQCPAPTKT